MKLNPNHPAIETATSIHKKRVVDVALEKNNIFKPASQNKKLGNGQGIITKGKLSGFPMFSLTLEERATCPSTCHHWADCYGNNMGFAKRYKAGKDLEDRIRVEIANLAKIYKKGFLVRLHVLGDFYSREYVNLWDEMLHEYQNLHVFGYTARTSLDPIGFRIEELRIHYGFRFMVRQSVKDAIIPMSAVEVPNSQSITCPQQTGKTASCMTCAFCWSTTKPVHFLSH